MYALPSSDFYDVAGGHNNGYSAATGYDMVTGLGVPNANLIVQNLVYGLGAPTTTTPATTVATPAVATTPATKAPVTKAPIAPAPHAPRWSNSPSRPTVVIELPGSVVACDPQQSEIGAINIATSAAETEASPFVDPAAPASPGDAATLGLPPADSGLTPAGVSVRHSSAAARAADAFFAELSGPQLVVSGAIAPAVG